MFTEAFYLEASFAAHEEFYGVPCGPTLSMIDSTKIGYHRELYEGMLEVIMNDGYRACLKELND